MDGLILKNKQRKKLLEMCMKLFPEFEDVEFGVNNKICKGWSNNYLLIYTKDFAGPKYIIHWFEFCVKYIIPKLSIDSEDRMIKITLFVELPNPIDYIYECFKK